MALVPMGLNYAAGSQVKSADINAIRTNITSLYADLKRMRFPTPFLATNWATQSSFNALPATPALVSSGAGDAYIDLEIPQGFRLSALTLMCLGNAAANLTIGVDKAPTTATANANIGSLVFPALAAAPADQTINVATGGASAGLTVTVNAAAFTFVRSAGSFITDGFLVGQTLTCAGFVNGGNNVAKVIGNVTPTVITVTNNAGLVNEVSGAAAVTAAAPSLSAVVDATFGLQLKLTASAAGLQVKSLRYTCIRT